MFVLTKVLLLLNNRRKPSFSNQKMLLSEVIINDSDMMCRMKILYYLQGKQKFVFHVESKNEFTQVCKYTKMYFVINLQQCRIGFAI